MSSGDLLSIQPTDLKFPFELRKHISCSLQLTNKTDEYVAFKVKTTNPKKYCVRPKTGIVLPGTICDVTVTMQAQNEAPHDMQCKDKFLFQTVTAPKGAIGEDITREMFNKESGKVIEEFKLGVIYIPANPPLPAPEGYSPWASGVENGSRGTSLIDVFNKESGKVFEEFKLKAIYVPANPPVPEESEEGSSPRASGVENENQGTYLFDAKKMPTKLQKRSKSMNKEKNILGKVILLLGKAKKKIGSQFELWSREKAIMAGYVELPNEEKLILASEKTQLETDVELLNMEKVKLQSDKDRLQIDIELLKKEKDALHKIVNEEEAEDFQLGWTVGMW